jgi:excinuclease ABC subunit C
MPEQHLKTKLEQLPPGSGCYIFKDARGKVIYVGKAKSLKARVRSYFQKVGPADPKTAALVAKVADLDLLLTDNESEALILEANLVREYRPRYNITLKDDKRYPYLKVTTQEPYPRLLVVRRVQKDGATYFGPYTNVGAMRRIARLISRVFMIRSCNLVIPPPGKRTYRVCLDYFIKRCPGPCEFKISEAEYGKLIHGACLFLAGRSRELFDELQQRMEQASAGEQFEEAALLRDQLEALSSVTQKQKVVTDEAINRDVLAFAREGKDAVVVTLQIRDGILIGRQEFHLMGDVSDSPAAIVTAFIKQYYLSAPLLPDEIYLPVDIDDLDLIGQWLSERMDRRVRLLRPQRGEKRKLVTMAEDNAQLVLRDLLVQRRGHSERPPASLVALAEAVVLDTVPQTIVAFDISHLGAESAVGACVFFDRGVPRKSEYRRFKVHAKTPDDYAAMREVVERYFKRRQADNKPMPDLVLIDGGRGQLSSAAEALYGLGLEDMPLVGLAKRLDELVFPYESDTRMLPKTSPALRLLQRLRDEAHRFANTYQRKLSRGRLDKSELDAIPGVGPAKKTALLNHFGSVEGVRKAKLADLAQVPGFGSKAARTLYHHLHPEPASEPDRTA